MRHVPQQLAGPRVQLVDYGIRGMHLAYDLLDGCEALVLVDALPNRGRRAPCTSSRPTTKAWPPQRVSMRTRWTRRGFASLNALGGTPPYTVVIGCEVENVDEGIGLSDTVAAAVPDAVRALEDVIARLLTPVREG